MLRGPGKAIVSLLVLTMLFTVMPGCSFSSKKTDGNPVPDTGQTTGKEAAPKPAEKLVIKMIAALYSPMDMNTDFWKGLEELTHTHLDIEWIPSDEFKTKFDLMLAAANIPELVSTEQPADLNLLKAMSQGMFWDLTPFLGDFKNYPNMKANVPDRAWIYQKNNGKWFRVPRPRAYINVGTVIRADWFEKAGFPDTSILTVDQLHQALKKISESDMDGNGKKDTLGLTFVEEYSGAFGCWDLDLDGNGLLIPQQLTQNYADMIEWYGKLYADGLMSKEFAVLKDNQMMEMFTTGKVATYWKNIWHTYNTEKEIQKVQPDGRVGLLAVMRGPRGDFARFDPGFVGSLLISKKVPQDKMLKILEYIDKTCSDDVSKFINYGQEGVHHTVKDGALVLTEKGAKEINNSTNIPFAIKPDEWFKVDSPIAPLSYNQKVRDRCKIMYNYGRVNPWNILRSETWSKEWPKSDQEFTTMRVKTITGAATVNEFRAYIDKLKAKPEFQSAFKEFTESRKEFFPDGNKKVGR